MGREEHPRCKGRCIYDRRTCRSVEWLGNLFALNRSGSSALLVAFGDLTNAFPLVKPFHGVKTKFSEVAPSVASPMKHEWASAG